MFVRPPVTMLWGELSRLLVKIETDFKKSFLVTNEISVDSTKSLGCSYALKDLLWISYLIRLRDFLLYIYFFDHWITAL